MTRKSNLIIVFSAAFILAATAFDSNAQTSTADLDRDGIPNSRDRDVDNDGILNINDRNIDGGTARSGLLRGRYVGDTLMNNSPQELDMDADGLADDAAGEADIDGDGLFDGELREADIDGDGLADGSAAETDIDGDGRADGASAETDIDGDGREDGTIGEWDIDGDGSANGLDGDVDGDGLANINDTDHDGTGINDDILYESPGNPPSYADDASVKTIIDYVSAEVRRVLQLSTNDAGLRVRVQPGSFAGRVNGVWRYFTSDQIQIWAKWAYSLSNPSDLTLFVNYSYVGPYTGNMEDYTNPTNYVISEENRFYSMLPRGPLTFFSWMPGSPVNFYYTAPNEQATGIPPPISALTTALSSIPGFYTRGDSFSGDVMPAFTGIQPVVNLLRTIQTVTRNWNGQFEASQLR